MKNSACSEEYPDQLSFDFDQEVPQERKEVYPKPQLKRNEEVPKSEDTNEGPCITQEEAVDNGGPKDAEVATTEDKCPIGSATTKTKSKTFFYNDWDRSTWAKVIAALLALLLLIAFCSWLLNRYMTDRSDLAEKTVPPIDKPTPPPKEDSPIERDDPRQEIELGPTIMEYELEVYVFKKQVEDGNTVVVAEGVTLIFCGKEPEETTIIEGAYNCIAFSSSGEIVESSTVEDSFPNNEGYAFQLSGPVTDFYTDSYGQFYVVIVGITAVFPQAPHAGIPSMAIGEENDIFFTRQGEIIDVVN